MQTLTVSARSLVDRRSKKKIGEILIGQRSITMVVCEIFKSVFAGVWTNNTKRYILVGRHRHKKLMGKWKRIDHQYLTKNVKCIGIFQCTSDIPLKAISNTCLEESRERLKLKEFQVVF